jgi:site-specific DNA-methyltransferase (adenine-specific)
MGKSWDNSGIAYSVELWRECLRVLKPGGHLLAFGGTRTWHRLAVAVEDAGFEIRDNIAWLYGSGFPKSHNISKAIDKAAGAERTVVGTRKLGGNAAQSWDEKSGKLYAADTSSVGVKPIDVDITASATDDAKAWDGWGTALKPAHEPIVVARKPLTGTVAQNVLEHGVGALNIDACRIGTEARIFNSKGIKPGQGNYVGDVWDKEQQLKSVEGRWPANIILDEYTAELLDQQSGISKDGTATRRNLDSTEKYDSYQGGFRKLTNDVGYGGQGGASRFFYVAKASKRDRNEGLDKLPEVESGHLASETGGGGGWSNDSHKNPNLPRQNFHPTVKPTALMQYLIRLVTPDNGVVLDPFAGSGSTGKAAILENKRFIGIELTAEYLPIIEGRLTHAYETLDSKEDLF